MSIKIWPQNFPRGRVSVPSGWTRGRGSGAITVSTGGRRRRRGRAPRFNKESHNFRRVSQVKIPGVGPFPDAYLCKFNFSLNLEEVTSSGVLVYKQFKANALENINITDSGTEDAKYFKTFFDTIYTVYDVYAIGWEITAANTNATQSVYVGVGIHYNNTVYSNIEDLKEGPLGMMRTINPESAGGCKTVMKGFCPLNKVFGVAKTGMQDTLYHGKLGVDPTNLARLSIYQIATNASTEVKVNWQICLRYYTRMHTRALKGGDA